MMHICIDNCALLKSIKHATVVRYRELSSDSRYNEAVYKLHNIVHKHSTEGYEVSWKVRSEPCLFMMKRNVVCSGGRPYEHKYSPCLLATTYSTIQCSLSSSPSSVLHTKATGKASIVVRCSEMNFDAEVDLFYQMEAGTVAQVDICLALAVLTTTLR